MSNKEFDFDIAVLGGGITGLGVALTAAEAGKTVCLIEKDQCSAATSASSLRIIHGGLRYLQKFDFPRVLESARDQSYCLKHWPELIEPLDCVLPLSGRGLKRNSLALMAGLMYGGLLKFLGSPLAIPKVIPHAVIKDIPYFEKQKPVGYLGWQDGLLSDPGLLAQSMLKQIRSLKAEVFEKTTVKSFKELNTGVLISAQSAEGAFVEIKANYAVNCLGPWVKDFESPFSPKWALAFNVILKKQYHNKTAFACDGEQGRFFFFVPRGQQSVLGTEYCELSEFPQEISPTAQMTEEFIASASRTMPALGLSMDDVSAVETGILPVKGFRHKNSPDFYGSSLIQRQGHVVHILSTKYTTFRSQAQKALRLAGI